MAKRRHKPTKAVTKPAAVSLARATARPDTTTAGERDNLIPAPQIRKLCGGISAMTFWRWQRSPKLACPPLTEINGRLYGSERAWLAWREEQKRAVACASSAA